MEAPRCKALLLVLIIMIIIFPKTSHSSAQDAHISPTTCYSSCGNIHNITFPFRLETDPPSCVSRVLYPAVAIVLTCKNNVTILNSTTFGDEGYYRVQAINYNNYTIRLVPSSIQKGNCSSIPKHSSIYSIPHLLQTEIKFQPAEKFWSSSKGTVRQISEAVLFLSCEKPVHNSLYIDTTPCINISSLSTSKQNISALSQNSKSQYSYVAYAIGFKYSDLAESCQVYHTALVALRKDNKKNRVTSYRDVHDELAFGFELSWVQNLQKQDGVDLCYVDEKYKVHCITYSCQRTRGARWCRLWKTIEQHLMVPLAYPVIGFIYPGYKYIVGVLATRTTIGISFVIALFIYKWRRRHLSMYDGIEEFLRSRNNLMPIRYAYSDIKKMTKGFKTKLGEGGFGSVYKGKLRSGHFVAVKMLGKSKAKGQDFINEVATIGRIHHVNVVRLVGFCAEGSKRALVYDFMPNGSLNKYIFPEEEKNRFYLSCKQMFQIAIGIAHGIEYLHQGCDMQILHFDIKPHNILLDENFIPKISDFGLARLCSLENSIVSLTAARGTIGYIAPELFYKNIGKVSHKADVYSFGMLLMEMANRRKNIDADTKNSSRIYFPSWIYDQFSRGNDIEIDELTEEELKTMKKMIVVALWCIQLKPFDRPIISKVIEMLESKVECLEMPPKPYLYPEEQEQEQEQKKLNVGEAGEASFSSTLSEEDSTEISLIVNAC